ncbi:MAG: hypothetical protein V3R94_09450 [Acidobacteriota bacterium]
MTWQASLKSVLTFGVVLILLGRVVPAQKFLPDDPILVDNDRLPIEMPAPVKLSQILDFVKSSYGWGLEKGEPIVPAENVDTLGEVPDSSWFTNRMGRRLMSLSELERGPNQLTGPDLSRTWVVVSAKSEGISKGFTIRDGHGDLYFIKFDPVTNPQMATSAEVIATKFFHAFGYHVPENYLVFISRNQLKVDSTSTTADEAGNKRRMTEKDVDDIFTQVPTRLDGTVQAIASLALSGKPLGPFEYFGTRPDDPNDIFPHQNRRELRGLRVFSAWLNHDDARAINTLNTYIEESDGGYVKHHLLDFGSCLGSGSVKPQSRRAGYEYIAELTPNLNSGLSLGWKDRAWRDIEYPDFPAVGRLESDLFEPAQWKTEYPNSAFIRMRPDDAFWATRIVLRFSDDMIRTLVGTGQFTDPRAENYLTETLIKRRDKLIQYFLSLINPLSDFRISVQSDSSHLEFKNLGVEAGLSSVSSYQFQWFRFDNGQNALEPLGELQSAGSETLPLPRDAAPFLMVRLVTLSPEQKSWEKKVEIFIRNAPAPSVVGIEREL